MTKKPQILFRRETNIRDLVTSSYIKEKGKNSSLTVGFHNCGKCRACIDSGVLKRKRIRKDVVSPDGKTTYKLKDFSTCDTEGVIYVIQCPCGKRYIGRTCRKIKTRIREHWRNIHLGLLIHNLSTHYKEQHQTPEGPSFWVLDRGGEVKMSTSSLVVRRVNGFTNLAPLFLTALIQIWN